MSADTPPDTASTIVGSPLPNLPWEDKPQDHPHPLWRYSANPIIGRSPFPTCNSVFNSAAVPFEGKFAGVFRCFVYSMGAALPDLEQPWRVIHRSKPYLLNPREDYECVGDVPNVVFPTAALCDAPSGRIAIYYGCADTVTGLAFCQADETLDWLAANSSG